MGRKTEVITDSHQTMKLCARTSITKRSTRLLTTVNLKDGDGKATTPLLLTDDLCVGSIRGAVSSSLALFTDAFGCESGSFMVITINLSNVTKNTHF